MENFNRLNDLYFKKLLGDKNRKNLTLSFLNAILNKDEREYFTDITFLDKDNEPLTLDGKLSKLDIRADLNDGNNRHNRYKSVRNIRSQSWLLSLRHFQIRTAAVLCCFRG